MASGGRLYDSTAASDKILTRPVASSAPPRTSLQPAAWTEHGTAAQASKSGVGAEVGVEVGLAAGGVVGAAVGASVGPVVGPQDTVVATQQLRSHKAKLVAHSPPASRASHTAGRLASEKRAAQVTQSVGAAEGLVDGCAVGWALGDVVGLAEGMAVGREVVGARVGWRVRILPPPAAAGSRTSTSASASASRGIDR